MAEKPIYVDAGVAHLLSSCSLLKTKTAKIENSVPPGVVKCFCLSVTTLQRATDASLYAGVEKFHKDFENGELDYLAVFSTLKLLNEERISRHSASIALFEELLAKIENDKREPFKNYYLAQAFLFGSYRWLATWGTRGREPFVPYGSSEMRDAFKMSSEQEYPSLGDHPYPGFSSYDYPASKGLNAPLVALIKAFDKMAFGAGREGHRRRGMHMSNIFGLLDGLKPGGDFEKAKEVFRSGFDGFPWDPHFHANLLIQGLEVGIALANNLEDKRNLYMVRSRVNFDPSHLFEELAYHSLNGDCLVMAGNVMLLSMPDYAGDYFLRARCAEGGNTYGHLYTPLGEVPERIDTISETFRVLLRDNPSGNHLAAWESALALEAK